MYSIASVTGNRRKSIADIVKKYKEKTNSHSSNWMKERNVKSVKAPIKGTKSLTIQETYTQRQNRRHHDTNITKVYEKDNTYSKLKVSNIIIFHN